MTVREKARLALRQVSANILHATDGRDVLHNSPDGWEVEQPWLWWSGGGGGQTVFGNPIPGANGSIYGGIPAVARATDLICNTLSTLPWHVYRDETERLPTPSWLADPQALRLDGRVVDSSSMREDRLSRVDFWGQWFTNWLWWGDGFVYVPTRDVNGAPKPPLWLVHPFDMELRDGRYWVGEIELEHGSVIHLRKPPIENGRGTGVLHRFAGQLGLAVALWEYVAGAFTAGVPAGYLKSSQPSMTAEQAETLKARWLSQHGGVRRSIAVLNATTDFHPLTWSPVDLAAVDFSKISLGQVALMFGIPGTFLGAPTDSNTYANVESRFIELKQLALQPVAEAAEAVLDAQLPLGTEVRIEFDALLRSDTKTRYETYKIAIEQGILSVDEIRELESRPPLDQPEPEPEGVL